MPQSGPDLVSAGYPISSPLLALLGGNGNLTQPNVAARSNLSFGLSGLTDVTTASAASGSVYTVAVPVVPGDTFTRVSFLTGAGSAGAASVTNLWTALYTGTGSAPGTAGAAPTYIASGVPGSVSSGTAGSVSVGPSTRADFTLTSPQTITSVQAPYGFIYVSYSVTLSSGAVSLISTTCASIAQYSWYTTSPYSLFMTSNGGAGSTAPTTIGAAIRAVNPPVVFLT